MRTPHLLFAAVLAMSLAGIAKEKRIIPNEAGNDNVDISADPVLDKDQQKQLIGAELPDGIIAVKVKFAPKGETPLTVNRDDFLLLSHKDGQRSGPYSPTQIAGNGAMVIRRQTQAGVSGDNNGPAWGGIPGTMGRPRRMPGGDGGSMGSNTAQVETASAEIKTDPKQKENPLVKMLEGKMLPEKDTASTVTGLLYFPLEGKVKPKDLELIYQGPAGRLYVNFH